MLCRYCAHLWPQKKYKTLSIPDSAVLRTLQEPPMAHLDVRMETQMWQMAVQITFCLIEYIYIYVYMCVCQERTLKNKKRIICYFAQVCTSIVLSGKNKTK